MQETGFDPWVMKILVRGNGTISYGKGNGAAKVGHDFMTPTAARRTSLIVCMISLTLPTLKIRLLYFIFLMQNSREKEKEKKQMMAKS